MKYVTKKLLKGKRFYFAVLICLLAAGAGTFSAVNDSAKQESEISRVTIVWDEEEPTSAMEVNEVVSGILDPRDSEEKSVTEKETVEQTAKTQYVLPVESKVIKGFSCGKPVYSATMEDWRAHPGVDLAAKAGDPVYNAADGTVSDVYTDGLWGTVIEVKISDSLSAKYCGLDEITAVKKGDSVKAGEKIGTAAAVPVESADESHIHFELLENGEAVDPMALFN